MSEWDQLLRSTGMGGTPPVCECGTSIWPGHEWTKWKRGLSGIFQRRECKNCGYQEEVIT